VATEADMARVRTKVQLDGVEADAQSALCRIGESRLTANFCTVGSRRWPISATTNGADRSPAASVFRPLGARITGSDWADGGLTPDDAVTLGKALKDCPMVVLLSLNLSCAQHGEVDFLNLTTARSFPTSVESLPGFAFRSGAQ
jgi:hypothetical protein